jgi:hypothetical protein
LNDHGNAQLDLWISIVYFRVVIPEFLFLNDLYQVLFLVILVEARLNHHPVKVTKEEKKQLA